MPGREGDLMDVNEAIVARHSVRRYTTRPIGDDAVGRLRAAIEEANEAPGLSIQFVRNEPDAFSNPLKTLGQFRNVSNYLAFVTPEGDDQDELVGYYGEGLILLAQQLGLNSCWVGGTFDRKRTVYRANPGQRLALVATLGYGGFLIGPPVIGWLAQATSLQVALGVLVLLAGVIAALAGHLAPAAPTAAAPTPADAASVDQAPGQRV